MITFYDECNIVNLSFQSFESAGISPGKFTEEYAQKRLEVREANSAKANLPATKQRRFQRKMERASTESAQEVLEGDTYESGKHNDLLLT